MYQNAFLATGLSRDQSLAEVTVFPKPAKLDFRGREGRNGERREAEGTKENDDGKGA